MTHQARYLLSRGDQLRVEMGRLIIDSASGLPVPADWMEANRLNICREILSAIGTDAFEYLGYQTGNYGRHKAGGVTLQFVSVLTGQSAYTIFNADLTRQRTVAGKEAGTPLPKGQFRIGKRSHFLGFWLSTGLPLPKRLSSFHDYMGKLKGVVFAAEIQGERLDAGSLRPICLSVDAVARAVMPDNCRTRSRQLPDNCRTIRPDKETHPSQTVRAFQPILATGQNNYGKTVIRESGNTGIPSVHPSADPEEQTVDEWLAEYGAAG